MTGRPGIPRRAALAGALASLVSGVSARAAEELPDECRDDAILVVDASGSMASTDPSGISRIHRVREAMAKVVPPIASSRNLGLIVYGGGATNGCSDIDLKVPPGPNNTNAILSAMRDVLPNGRTPLTESLSRAAETLKFRSKPATIVLLTDGEESCGGDPCKLAGKLTREGVRTRVHVIDYKHRGFNADWRGVLQAQCLAETTGGRYLAVDTLQELISALRETLGCPFVTGREQYLAAGPRP